MTAGPFGPLGTVDLALLAVLAASTLIGLWRGLVFEVMALVGWLVAYVAAQSGADWVAAQLPTGVLAALDNPTLRLGLGFALAFIGALMAWTLLARLARLVVQATPLTVLDRMFGALFGLARGGVLLLVLATVLPLTPLAKSQPWQASKGAAWLATVLQGLKPVLPEAWGRQLPGSADARTLPPALTMWRALQPMKPTWPVELADRHGGRANAPA